MDIEDSFIYIFVILIIKNYMKKIRNLLIPVMLVLFISTFSGCSLLNKEKTNEDASKVVKEAFKNLYSVKSNTYDVSLTGTFSDTSEKMDYDFSLTGAEDMNDPKKPKFTMVIDGTGSFTGYENQSVKAEIRMNESSLYFVLNEISDFGGSLPSELVAPYVGKWYKMAIPEGTFDNYPVLFADDQNLSEQDKKLKELLENTSFFKEIEYTGTEGNLDIYKAVLDKEAVKNFMIEATKIEGTTVSEAEEKDLEDGLKMMELDVTLGVDKEKNVLTEMKGVLEINAEADGTGSMEFEASIGNLDEPVTIDVPTDVSEFDPVQLFGAAFMMGGGYGSGYDPYSVDPYGEIEDVYGGETEGIIVD